jgi:diguanylate cyclase (GGDEF)-like protein/PAS domain S-box-containing protein
MKTSIKAMIVDDNPDDASLLRRYLKKLPLWQVTCAMCETGREALTKADEFAPDIIFVNYTLGTESGIEVIHSLKEYGSSAAFILLTGTGGEREAVEALHVGASDYLKKEELSIETLERSMRHIMGRKRAEDELRKSREGLLAAQAIAHIGNWDWNIVTGELTWTDEIYRIFGIKPQEFGATYEASLSSVHPDDRESVRNAVNEAVDQKKDYGIEHRVVRPDGSERIVHERGKVFYDDNGKPLRMIGIIYDITERKKAEEKLRMAAKVIENTSEGVVVTDSNAIIQSVNPAITEITGYSEEEVIGKRPNVWKSNRHEKEFYKNLWASLLKKGRWAGEIWNRRKNGEAFPARQIISAIKDAEGRTIQYVSVMHDMTEIKNIQREAEHRAYHDALTELPNRLLFFDRLDQTIQRAKRDGRIFGVLCVNVDNFKNINDSMGHVAGDALLKQVAARLSGCTPEISRLGGDEFAIILDNIDLEQEAGITALKIKESFSEPFIHNDEELFISVSIGIALYPSDGNSAEEILKNADMAMSHIKKRGKDNLSYFTESLNEKAQKRARLEKSLRRAISKDEFVVYYQPKVDIQSGKITGMEALVRWEQPDGKLVPPGDFIPVAEKTGLILPIGEIVMRKACRQTFKWQKNYNPPLRVSVNLSVRQFQNKSIIGVVKSILQETGLSPSLLELEITESMVMTDMETAIETMSAFSKMGIQISIDDFGTGYSSLGYLKRFPINSLKIDRSFVRDIPGDSDSAAIASAIISMSKSLNLKVIAEGVETMEQLEFLRERGCDEMQGYLFSKPLPGDEFEKLLKDGRGLYRRAVPTDKTATLQVEATTAKPPKHM